MENILAISNMRVFQNLFFMLLPLFILLILTIIQVFSYCRIFSKAGYNWAFGLLLLIPMAYFVIPIVLALMDWPVCKELSLFKQEQCSGTQT